MTSDADKANLLNDFFGFVFSIDNGQLPPFSNRLPDAKHCIGNITVNPDLVFKVLMKLKPNLGYLAAGPDELPPIVYYNTATNLSYPLALLFRSFILTSLKLRRLEKISDNIQSQEQWRHLGCGLRGGGGWGSRPPRKKKKGKRKRKEKKDYVQFLHIKCCFFQFNVQ